MLMNLSSMIEYRYGAVRAVGADVTVISLLMQWGKARTP